MKKLKAKNPVNIFIVLPVVFFGLFLLLAIAGGNTRVERPAETLVHSLRSEPRFLNPVLVSDVNPVIGFIFNTLVRYDKNMEIVPDLAEKWEIKDGGRRVIFHIRKGVKWHDGKELTAYDCAFTFQKTLDPKTNTFNASLFRIDGRNIEFEATDKYILEARLQRPFAPFLNNLTLVGIVPRHILKDDDINKAQFNRSPVGTGPFKFKQWKISEKIILKANEDYFRGKPKLKSLIFKILPSQEGNRIALISGQVDFAALTPEDMALMKNLPKHVKIYKWENFIYYYLAFDLTNKKFKDLNTRRAINYAIDTRTLTRASLHGTGTPIYGPIPRASWAYYPGVNKYKYNPGRARQLLDEAGWKLKEGGIRYRNGERFEFDLIHASGSHASEAACIYIQSYLKDVGIKVNLKALDKGALIKSLYPGQFEAVVFDWVEPFDPDIYTEWQSEQVQDGMNFMSYSDSEVDRLLSRARSTFDRKKRKELYKKIQVKIVEDAPYVFLWNAESIIGVNSRVKDLAPPSPVGLLADPEDVWVEE